MQTKTKSSTHSVWTVRLDRSVERLLVALTYLSGAILVFMAASVVIEVVMRYFLGRPTRWVVEFSEYMLLYMAFLPAAWVLNKDKHVKIDLVLALLPDRAQTTVNALTSVIGAFLCGLFFWSSAALTWETFRSSEVLFRAVHVPKWAVLVAVPIGTLLLTVQFIRRTGRYLKGLGRAPK